MIGVTDDTIVAIASPPGPSVRGLVRISGPRALPIAADTFQASDEYDSPLTPSRRQGWLRLDGVAPLLPVSLFVWPGNRSYTGQPVAEIHTIGSPPLLDRVVAHALARGARLAEPGEFTMRAFLAGRIDLTQAEAVLGAIQAEDRQGAEAALAQLAGGLATPIRTVRGDLLDRLALLEANLDFADEPDVDFVDRPAFAQALERSAEVLARLNANLDARDRPNTRHRVVLAGPPNAGKSRLFNALAGEDRAIVSPEAGTTRDYLTAEIRCDGLAIELVDTAGEDDARDEVDQSAQAHRRNQLGRANLILECRTVDDSHGMVSRDGAPILKIWTQADLRPPRDDSALITSAVTGLGLDRLRSAIAAELRAGRKDYSPLAATAARCRDSLLGAERALRDAATLLVDGEGDELVAADLRRALDDLGRVVGEIVTDDLLDRIFGRFCIGK